MRVSADDDRCRRVRVGVTIGVQYGFQGTQLGHRGLTELAGSSSDLELGRKAMVTSLPPRLTPPSAEPSDRIQAARDGKGHRRTRPPLFLSAPSRHGGHPGYLEADRARLTYLADRA